MQRLHSAKYGMRALNVLYGITNLAYRWAKIIQSCLAYQVDDVSSAMLP